MGDVFIGKVDGTGWEHVGFATESDFVGPEASLTHRGELDQRAASVYAGADLTSLWPPIERVVFRFGPDGYYSRTIYYRQPPSGWPTD